MEMDCYGDHCVVANGISLDSDNIEDCILRNPRFSLLFQFVGEGF